MKIVFLLDVYPHPFKPYFDVQFEDLASAGHEVHVISLGTVDDRSGEHVPDGVRWQRLWGFREQPVRRLMAILSRAVRSPGRFVRTVRTCRAAAVRPSEYLRALIIDSQLPLRDPDLFFAHNLAAAIHYWFLPHVRPSTPYAMYYHGGELPGMPTIPDALARRAFGASRVVFTNTPKAGRDVAERGCDPEKIRVVPVGFRTEDFVPSDEAPYWPDTEVRLLAVGRVSVEKGLDVAVRALVDLGRRRKDFFFSLTVVGDGPDLARIKTLAGDMGVRERVRFAGRLNHREVVAEMREADALLLCSVGGNTATETQAAVLQEAMLMRLPVVASAIGGVPESVPPELHSFLYPPGDGDQLVDRVLALFSNGKEAARRLGEVGRRFVLEGYDVRVTNRRLLEHALETAEPAAAPALSVPPPSA